MNRENLSTEIPDIRESIDTWVDGRYIYLLFKKEIIKYSIDNNNFQTMNSTEGLSKMLAFENQSYYWRTVLGGTNDSRYVSKIYFDMIEDVG